MTNAMTKTAAAFAALIAANGAGQAAAEDLTFDAGQPAFVLANLQSAMDANRDRVFELVLNTAEARMEGKIAKIENFTMPIPRANTSFTVALLAKE